MDFNFKSFISNVFYKYKCKYQNHKKNLGVLSLVRNLSIKQDVTLTRCFLRDGDQMNRGNNDFDKEAYASFFSKLIVDLPDYDSDSISIAIYSKFNNIFEFKIELPDTQIDTLEDDMDENDSFEDIENENNNMMLLMAQMGLPTQFSSTKAKTNMNKKNKKFHDMDMIFDCIKDNVMRLLSDNNELMKQWISNQRKETDKAIIRAFCNMLLIDVSFNEEIKKMIKCLFDDRGLESIAEKDINENDLLTSFIDAIDCYVDLKYINWLQDLNFSDSYKSMITFQNDEFLEYLLSSIGLAYKSDVPINTHMIYPIIPARTITYSLNHDLSLYIFDESEDTEFEIVDEDPMNKYYYQRYRFFDKFDEGILLDEESWYSVTPSIIAKHTATRFKKLLNANQRPVIIDAFCGAGGNTIRFAEEGFIVLAVDIDEQKLKILLHNATIYGVVDNIVPICHDYFDLMDWISGDRCPDAIAALFALAIGVNISPPWGGPEYLIRDVFDVTVMHFDAIMSAAGQLSPNISCFIPRQSNCSQIISWFLNNGGTTAPAVRYDRFEIEQNCVNNKIKAITLYTNQLTQCPDLVFI